MVHYPPGPGGYEAAGFLVGGRNRIDFKGDQWLASMGYNVLLNEVYWGYNPLNI